MFSIRIIILIGFPIDLIGVSDAAALSAENVRGVCVTSGAREMLADELQ
jgi:hypothetical protein